jgi:hypothetical protein
MRLDRFSDSLKIVSMAKQSTKMKDTSMPGAT